MVSAFLTRELIARCDFNELNLYADLKKPHGEKDKTWVEGGERFE